MSRKCIVWPNDSVLVAGVGLLVCAVLISACAQSTEQTSDRAELGFIDGLRGCDRPTKGLTVNKYWVWYLNKHKGLLDDQPRQKKALSLLIETLANAKGYTNAEYSTTLSDFMDVDITEEEYLAFYQLILKNNETFNAFTLWSPDANYNPFVVVDPEERDIERINLESQNKTVAQYFTSPQWASKLRDIRVSIEAKAKDGDAGLISFDAELGFLCTVDGLQLLHLESNLRAAVVEKLNAPKPLSGCTVRLFSSTIPPLQDERYPFFTALSLNGAVGPNAFDRTLYVMAPYAHIRPAKKLLFQKQHVEIFASEMFRQAITRPKGTWAFTVLGPFASTVERFEYTSQNPGFFLTPVGRIPVDPGVWAKFVN